MNIINYYFFKEVNRFVMLIYIYILKLLFKFIYTIYYK